ncbi:MAG: PPC domain-containing protein [Phycisphaerales bacterium]|nr:PPC domain-containing protein [Phycisphaerales bacterium]
MKTAATLLAVLGLASAANAGVTLDDLSIATITGGSSTSGDTSGSADNMNGGSGIGSGGSWSGGDDVYTLNWAGGDLVADLLFTHADGDIDLYVWGDNAATVLLGSSTSTSDNEQVSVAGLAAGTYYISVDGWFGDSNSYKLQLNGVPTPASAALLGLGGLVATRRRRA